MSDGRSGRDATGQVEDREQVWAALGRLPRRQRAVVVLRFYEDLSEEQTAAVLGITVGTVKSQSSKALRAMRLDPHLAVGPDVPGSSRQAGDVVGLQRHPAEEVGRG